MKRYIRASHRRRRRIDVERATKMLTFKESCGLDYNLDGFEFTDEDGNEWMYESPVDYNGRATTSFGKLLQETTEGKQLRVSGYFIPSSRPNASGTIYNPRLLR